MSEIIQTKEMSAHELLQKLLGADDSQKEIEIQETNTKLDLLREELADRGIPKVQLNSRLLPVVLDVIENSPDKYMKLWRNENKESARLEDLKRQAQEKEEKIASAMKKCEMFERDFKEIEKIKTEIQEYITSFYQSIKSCETEEGRDTMRKLQVFLDLVDVGSTGNQTAFINALGNILSQGKIESNFGYKKVSRTEPHISEVK